MRTNGNGAAELYERNGDELADKASSTRFTLVELLIVITVIAMLTSLLLPALGKARESVNRTSCASKMKQLGLCFSMYGNDNDDYVFPGWEDSFGYLKSYDVYMKEYFGGGNNEGTTTFYQKRPYLECPSDRVERGLPDRLRSYSMNLGGWDYTVTTDLRGPTSKNGTCRFTQILVSASTVLFFENRMYWNVTGGTNLSATDGYFSSVLSKGGLAHARGWNFAFCDGHVELININDWKIGLMTVKPTD